jgi:peptidoglycan/xylan/chitin deacetylase (PgdA/CDA1 family)
MYHGVCDAPSDALGPWKYTVSPSDFEEQIERLSDRYTVVSLNEAMDEVDGSEDLAVVTFDDGYRNNLTNAVPILERYGVPATVYVSTAFVNGEIPYEYVVADALLEKDSIDITLAGNEIREKLETPASRLRVFEKVKEVAKTSPEVRKEVSRKLSRDGTQVSMLDPDEIRELDTHPLTTVGAHGHQHLPLASVSESVVEQEIRECTAVLEDILGHGVSHFSYPYGSNDAGVRKRVREEGYKTAVTTEASYLKKQCLDRKRYELPRFDASVTGVR